MGNLLITLISVFVPITIHTSIIPTLMRPDILGGSPWSPPSMLTYVVLYYSIMYFILWLASFIGNIYYTLVNCNKMDPVKMKKTAMTMNSFMKDSTSKLRTMKDEDGNMIGEKLFSAMEDPLQMAKDIHEGKFVLPGQPI